MLLEKFSVHNEVDDMTIFLYTNNEFGYSIHEFEVNLNEGKYELILPDLRTFTLLAQILKTSGNKLKEYILDGFVQKLKVP